MNSYLICVRNIVTDGYASPFKLPITIGEKYKIKGTRTNRSNELFYLLLNDNGHMNYYLPYYFITVQEYREKQLNKLLCQSI